MVSPKPKVQCELCGRMISKSNIKSHLRSHENGKFHERQPKHASIDHDDLFCKHCGRECKNRNSLIQHEIRCKENPNRLSFAVPSIRFTAKGRTPWNKGLTKETDERLARYANKSREIYPETELSRQLDDDGRLYHDYRERIYTSKNGPHKFYLTFDEYCHLLSRAGLKSSDLGYNGNHYDLARYGDDGDYTFDNCRFLSHQMNLKEHVYRHEILEFIKTLGEITPEEKEIRVNSFLCSKMNKSTQ